MTTYTSKNVTILGLQNVLQWVITAAGFYKRFMISIGSGDGYFEMRTKKLSPVKLLLTESHPPEKVYYDSDFPTITELYEKYSIISNNCFIFFDGNSKFDEALNAIEILNPVAFIFIYSDTKHEFFNWLEKQTNYFLFHKSFRKINNESDEEKVNIAWWQNISSKKTPDVIFPEEYTLDEQDKIDELYSEIKDDLSDGETEELKQILEENNLMTNLISKLMLTSDTDILSDTQIDEMKKLYTST